MSCHPKLASGSLQVGFSRRDSSTFTAALKLFTLAHITFLSNEPPFDRHDWIVKRKSSGEEVRYVIDYYSAPPDPHGSPVFSLDVRPALDSLGSVKQRIAVATEEAWASLRTQSPSSA